MASLFRRRLKSGVTWYGQVKLRDGRWKAFNTHCRKRKDAEKVLEVTQGEIWAGRNPFDKKARIGRQLSELFEPYLSACAERGLRSATVRSYKGTLVRLQEATGDIRITDIDKEAIQRFKSSFQDHHSRHTQNIHLTNLRAFLNWTKKELSLEDWQLPDVKPIHLDPLPVLDYYNPTECNSLLAAAERVTIHSRQLDIDFPFVNFVAFLMLTGMRKMEAAETRWEPPQRMKFPWPWVDRSRLQIVVPASASKSHRPRYIPILSELQEILESWPIEPRGKLFPFSAESGKLTAKWREVVESAGVRYLKLHCLRDTFAVNLLLSGVPWVVVGEILGHASVETTRRYYAAVGPPELKTALAGIKTDFMKNLLPES